MTLSDLVQLGSLPLKRCCLQHSSSELNSMSESLTLNTSRIMDEQIQIFPKIPDKPATVLSTVSCSTPEIFKVISFLKTFEIWIDSIVFYVRRRPSLRPRLWIRNTQFKNLNTRQQDSGVADVKYRNDEDDEDEDRKGRDMETLTREQLPRVSAVHWHMRQTNTPHTQNTPPLPLPFYPRYILIPLKNWASRRAPVRNRTDKQLQQILTDTIFLISFYSTRWFRTFYFELFFTGKRKLLPNVKK